MKAVEEVKLKWYENGKFILMPNNWYFNLWRAGKGFVYLTSMYILTYDMAFNFEAPSDIYLYVDVIQLIDITLTFFTAVKVRNLSEYVQRYRSNKLSLIEDEGMELGSSQTVSKCRSD